MSGSALAMAAPWPLVPAHDPTARPVWQEAIAACADEESTLRAIRAAMDDVAALAAEESERLPRIFPSPEKVLGPMLCRALEQHLGPCARPRAACPGLVGRVRRDCISHTADNRRGRGKHRATDARPSPLPVQLWP
jgi:hypothetical protein